jgi:hypothetical protein
MRFFVIAVLTIALWSCAAERDPGTAVMIAPGVRFVTPGPQALGYRVVAQQMISAHYRGDSFVWEAHIAVSPEKLEIVGLDAFGRRAFTMTWGGGVLSYEAASWLPATVKPGNVLADIAILYWPQAAIRDALAGSGAIVATTASGRSIMVDGAEIIHVDYDGDGARDWRGTAHFRNLAFGYQLDIQSVREP